ncbi:MULTISPECIES: CBS domain-containing protein [Haloarcula]|uniref:Zinc metalloprotease n=1 Tax=Haloarcula pellucida TaxID=1427151 RepID=A0A830GQ29_9EURY|nr:MULTISPECIES: CBS domain-containing protein [Halomicroarcula]MBX0349398.1 CBS domain-containing protein [Halomicroarcula pellucida]MDS0279016.1 CBS domain-containing protein [Halomicroarcula sp. S1AR25-4]GGO03134.1 metalloprotease [Halomicroarcula pellucida]
MRRFRIGSAFGIPIQLDLTFLLVLPLFAWIIGTQVEQTTELLNDSLGAGLDPAVLTDGSLVWVLGVVAAVGLFTGVVLHELGHSLVAIRYGYPIDSITLWLFGGIAQLTETPEDWKQELAIAVAGPLVSVALGVLSYLAFFVLPGTQSTIVEAARFVLAYLAVMNLALAVFNMLPGFPMDGGRVLRALLARTRPYARATKIAAEVGKIFAIMLGLFGLFVAGNIFLAGLAFFIYIGAEGESRQTAMAAAFEGVTVQDVMTPADHVTSVTPRMSVRELIQTMFEERHTGYPVETDGEVVGLVTLEDARAVREVEREAYTVGDVMSTDLYTVSPDADVMDALTQLQQNSVGRLVVTDEDGEFLGLLTRSDIMTALSIIKSSSEYGSVGESESRTLRPEP